MLLRRRITRRAAIGGAVAAGAANAAFARGFGLERLSGGTPASGGLPSITGLTIAGSTTTAGFAASTANAPAGPIVITTTDSSVANFTISGNAEGFHPSSGASGTQLLAPPGGLPGPSYTDVTITAVGSYSNSGAISINPTLIATSGVLTVDQNVSRPTGQMWEFGSLPADRGPQAEYDDAYIMATITGGPGNTTDFLAWAQPSEPDTAWHNPIYLNGKTTPPSSGLTNASVVMPSVPATFFTDDTPAWNPSLNVPVKLSGSAATITSWQLRFYNGVTNAVIARQAITIDILSRTGFTNNYWFYIRDYSISGQYAISFFIRPTSGVIPGGAGTEYNCVSGSIGINLAGSIGYFPALPGTLTLVYTVDNVPVSPLVTGTAGGSSSSVPYTLDTTTLTDGTHALGALVIDFIPGSGSTDQSQTYPRFWVCWQQIILVKNGSETFAELYSGSSGALPIPLIDDRIFSSVADSVQHPGTNALPMHSTVVGIPLPQSGVIPPVCNSASPFFDNSTALLGTPANNFYYESMSGSIPREYQSQQRFFTTRLGGIFAYPSYPEADQALPNDYTISVSVQYPDGGRCDNDVYLISSAIEGTDPTNATPSLRSFWLVFEMGGRIVRLDYTGQATTLWGFVGNRSVLPYPSSDVDNSFTEDEYNTRLNMVGAVGSPSFGDLRGMNDGCYDPRDTTYNTLFVANTCNQSINQITGLLGGSPTTVRYAGQDAGLSGTSVAPNFVGDYQDGVRTEFIAGSTVATFTGTINGSTGVLTISGTYIGGTNLKGCPISWSGNPNTTTGNMITTNVSGSGTGSTWNTNVTANTGPIAMTASTQVALFNQPYSCQMADGTTTGSDPAGTVYVCDTLNSALRRIDVSTGLVTTLLGNQDIPPQVNSQITMNGFSGPLATGSGGVVANVTQYTISTMSWSAGVLTVVTTVPVQGDTRHGFSAAIHTIKPYWSIGFASTGASFDTASGNILGNDPTTFVVASVTDAQHFTVTMPTDPGTIPPQSGAGYVFAYFQDILVRPGPMSVSTIPWAHGTSSEAYFPWMQRIIWTSQNPTGSSTNTRHLVAGGPWTGAVIELDLSAQTVRTIGYNAGTLGSPAIPYARGGMSGGDGISATSVSWFQIDVDNRYNVASGSVGDATAGCVGPLNDVIIANTSSSIINQLWRLSWDGSRSSGFTQQDPGQAGIVNPLPFNTTAGQGHYPWMVAISRSQGRLLGSGTSDIGLNGMRILNTAYDIPAPGYQTPAYYPRTATRGFSTYIHGTATDWIWTNQPSAWPRNMRPNMSHLHGPTGFQQLWGLSATTINGSGVSAANTESLDALTLQFPTDAGLAAFIQAGFGGSTPRPELTGDDLEDLIYWIRRSSQKGSFNLPLVRRNQYATNVTAPVISAVTCTRQSTVTEILVTWTTSDSSGQAVGSGGGTYGVVVVGFVGAHGSTSPYHLFFPEAWGGTAAASYSNTHSVLCTHCQPGSTSPAYIRVLAKDFAGNNAISAEQTVT